jgi:hypothetical protein
MLSLFTARPIDLIGLNHARESDAPNTTIA